VKYNGPNYNQIEVRWHPNFFMKCDVESEGASTKVPTRSQDCSMCGHVGRLQISWFLLNYEAYLIAKDF